MSYTVSETKDDIVERRENEQSQQRKGRRKDQLEERRIALTALKDYIKAHRETVVDEVAKICTKSKKDSKLYKDPISAEADYREFWQLCKNAGYRLKTDILKFVQQTIRELEAIEIKGESAVPEIPDNPQMQMQMKSPPQLQDNSKNVSFKPITITREEGKKMINSQPSAGLSVQPQLQDNPQVQLQNISQTLRSAPEVQPIPQISLQDFPPIVIQDEPQMQIPNTNFSNIEMNQQPQYPQALLNKINKINSNTKLTTHQKQVEVNNLIKTYNKNLGKSKEDLAAKATGITPERTYQTQPNLKFAELNQLPPGRTFMNNLTEQQWNDIKDNDKNSWVKAFDTARDIKFNPKMLDPAYAAWKGRVNGTAVYYQDFNGDKIEDILEYDPDHDRIVTYNGYSSKLSKQKLYKEFYESAKGKAVGNAEGRPIYPSTMKQWYADELINTYNTPEARRNYNEGLGKINMEGFKVKNKTISEMVKDVFNKQLYEHYLNTISQKMQIPIKKIKTLLPRQTIVSMLMKSFLITWFGEQLTGDKEQDTKTFNTICKFLNMKNKTDNGANGPECKAKVYNTLKQAIEGGYVHNRLGLQEYINNLWIALVQNMNYSNAIKIFTINPDQNLTNQLQLYKQYAQGKAEQLAARNAGRTVLYA